MMKGLNRANALVKTTLPYPAKLLLRSLRKEPVPISQIWACEHGKMPIWQSDERRYRYLKSYLIEKEIKELGRIVSIYLDYAEN
jgi:hypothetical protein